MKPILLTLSTTLFASLISNQTFADDLAKSSCVQPIIPQPYASDVVLKQFEKKMDKYKTCITKFIDEQQDLSKSSPDTVKANLAHDAAQSAIKEYNDFMAARNERTKRANALNGADDDDEAK